MHAWDQPAEVLLKRTPQGLLMPQLGEPTEPAHAAKVRPWWREVDAADAPPAGEKQEELARTLPYPMD